MINVILINLEKLKCYLLNTCFKGPVMHIDYLLRYARFKSKRWLVFVGLPIHLNNLLQQGKRWGKSKRPQPTDLPRKQISMWKFRWRQISFCDPGSHLHESRHTHALQFRSATPAQLCSSGPKRFHHPHQQLRQSEPPSLQHARRSSQLHDGQPGGTWIIKNNLLNKNSYVNIYQTFIVELKGLISTIWYGQHPHLQSLREEHWKYCNKFTITKE